MGIFMGILSSPIIIIGIIMIIIGIKIYISVSKFLKIAKSTQAEITDIKTERDFDNDLHHTVFVAFNVDGETYHGKIIEYNSTMSVGKKITIYYDPANPNNFKGPSPRFPAYILMILGVIFVFTSINTVYNIF